MLLTLFAFVVALGLLIAVHEWGHYRMAVARGVRVLLAEQAGALDDDPATLRRLQAAP